MPFSRMVNRLEGSLALTYHCFLEWVCGRCDPYCLMEHTLTSGCRTSSPRFSIPIDPRGYRGFVWGCGMFPPEFLNGARSFFSSRCFCFLCSLLPACRVVGCLESSTVSPDAEQLEEDYECPICLEDVDEETAVMTKEPCFGSKDISRLACWCGIGRE